MVANYLKISTLLDALFILFCLRALNLVCQRKISLSYSNESHLIPRPCYRPGPNSTPFISSHFPRTPGMHLFRIFFLFIFYNLTVEADGFFENLFPPKASRQVPFDVLFFGSPKFEQEVFIETARSFQPSRKINNFEDARKLLQYTLQEITNKSREFVQEMADRRIECKIIDLNADVSIFGLISTNPSDFREIVYEVATCQKDFVGKLKEIDRAAKQSFNQKMDEFLAKNNLKPNEIDHHSLTNHINYIFYESFESSKAPVKAQIIEELKQNLKSESTNLPPDINPENWKNLQFQKAFQHVYCSSAEHTELMKKFQEYAKSSIYIFDDQDLAFGKSSEGFNLAPSDSIYTEYKKRLLKILQYYRRNKRQSTLSFYRKWIKYFPGLLEEPAGYQAPEPHNTVPQPGPQPGPQPTKSTKGKTINPLTKYLLPIVILVVATFALTATLFFLLRRRKQQLNDP